MKKMTRKEIISKARAARTGIKTVYVGKDYTIKMDNFNYIIDIHLPKKPRCRTISRRHYTSSDNDLAHAHAVARYSIDEFFIKD
jgi:hypothetical protein